MSTDSQLVVFQEGLNNDDSLTLGGSRKNS